LAAASGSLKEKEFLKSARSARKLSHGRRTLGSVRAIMSTESEASASASFGLGTYLRVSETRREIHGMESWVSPPSCTTMTATPWDGTKSMYVMKKPRESGSTIHNTPER
jgi:hypothetical protein